MNHEPVIRVRQITIRMAIDVQGVTVEDQPGTRLGFRAKDQQTV